MDFGFWLWSSFIDNINEFKKQQNTEPHMREREREKF